LEELNKAIGEKILAQNRKRMQQHPYTREEQFIATEKPELRPLPQDRFEVRFYASLKVSTNEFVFLGRDKHYYSAPHVYIGQ